MDIKQLETFYMLSTELNFTRAADKLGYSQSCVTQHIKKLEDELQVPLFNRIGKRVTLTEAGSELLPSVRQLLQMTKNLEKLSKESFGNVGTIRIGICDSLCIEKMPAIIKAFRRAYPYVDIYLHILKCSQFLSELSHDTIDLAYTIGYLDKVPEIEYAAEVNEPILVLASSNDPLVTRTNLSASDFAGVPLILSEPAAYYRKNFLSDLERGHIKPKIILETESIQAIKNLTESGLGVCVLPQVAANAEIKAGKLVPLNYVCDYNIKSQIIWHRDKWLPKIMEEFIRIAKEVIEQYDEQLKKQTLLYSDTPRV